MTYEVGVVGSFTAQHHLVGDFGPASLPHGHTYRVDAEVTGAALRDNGTLFDITSLQQALDAILGQLNDCNLNGIDAFRRLNPTAEVVAKYIFEGVAPALGQRGLGELRIRVWESADAFAAYVDALT
ncbi:MAG TPA: 6-carboxytetrahydropterin synthase [Chloroflexota bacterium]|jgi:6-pyruvoyltetrahydropterin/6-carboxytetrahydropterin synthase|nr:6-carboxytetrahydropterin synthase [Chloroflexota bacterium]